MGRASKEAGYDTVERVDAEMQARHLASVLRNSNDAVILTTPDGVITSWNQGAAKAYGYGEEEAIGMNLREIIPADFEGTVAEVTARLQNGEDVESFETRRVTREGRVLDVWVTLTPLRDDNGSLISLARTERDISDRRRAENEIRRLNAELVHRISERSSALAASEQRIAAVLDTAVDAILVIDSKGTIETFNRSAEKMFGYTQKEAIGRNVSVLMTDAHAGGHESYIARYLDSGEARLIGRPREFRARRKDGTEFPILLSVSPVEELGLFTGIIRDITEQRELQAEIVRLVTQEQRRIGEELHDTTQQELTGLGLLAQHLAERETLEETERARDIAMKIASGIAETNLHVKRLARGLVPVPIDVDGLMFALAELSRRTTEETGIQCEFLCPSPVEVADDTTALQLYRIAQEAVTNAVKHASAESISIHLDRSTAGTIIEVRDDGIGIPESRDRTGGLGLRIMRHRCELIGGVFDARQLESGGTLISCRIAP